MKTVTMTFLILSFLLACGQTTQMKKSSRDNVEELHNESDIGMLWSNRLQQLNFVRQLDTNEINNLEIDLSQILAYNKYENEYLSRFIGALGNNYQRIDLLLLSAKHLGQQHYSINLLLKLENNIDTLRGEMILRTAFEIPEGIQIKYIYSFAYNFCTDDKKICLEGINSISFYLEDKLPKNYWYDDGSFNEYVRTFVGKMINQKTSEKMNCVFAVSPAGLYNYLPFCEGLYWVDEEDNPDYYFISEKYRQFGWQDYDYENPKKTKWWKY